MPAVCFVPSWHSTKITYLTCGRVFETPLLPKFPPGRITAENTGDKKIKSGILKLRTQTIDSKESGKTHTRLQKIRLKFPASSRRMMADITVKNAGYLNRHVFSKSISGGSL